MVNIDLGVLPRTQWLSATDASGLLLSAQAASSQGIAVSGVISASRRRTAATQLGGIGTAPITAGYAVPRPRVESVFSFPAAGFGYAPASDGIGQAAAGKNSTAMHNSTVKHYGASVDVIVGVGTSGPPRGQEPA